MNPSAIWSAKHLLPALAIAALAGRPVAAQTITTRVDEARHEVSITASPFGVPAVAGNEHAGHAGMDHKAPSATDHNSMRSEAPRHVLRFDWPVDGYGRAFRVEMRDSRGRLLPRSILHHIIGINLDRRQMIYPAAERLFGLGKETEALVLPGSLVVPLARGQRLGFYVAWHNDTGKDLEGVSITLVITYVPQAAARSLVSVIPVYLDVNNTVGETNVFDLPTGKSTKTFEFVAPVDGRILGVGGHLHDYGIEVRLDDAESGAPLVKLPGKRDAAGRIVSMPRKFYAFNAVRLKAGHRYRVVAEYDSPLKATLVDGAMGNLIAMVSPADMTKWPPVVISDPLFQRDLGSLGIPGAHSEGPPAGRSGTSNR